MSNFGAVIVAAGKGTRMGTRESKQYLALNGKPIIVHTLEAFSRIPWLQEIVLVTGMEDVHRCESWIQEYGLGKVSAVIPGKREAAVRIPRHQANFFRMGNDT